MDLRRYFKILYILFLPTSSRSLSILQAPDVSLITSSKNEIFDIIYPGTNTSRYHVPKILRGWDVHVQGYKPPYIIHPSVLGQPWADPEDVSGIVDKFNTLDGKEGEELDRRRSARGVKYQVENKTGRPLNPTGRTGVAGRGLLGRWGPNYSAHLIVTRWFRDQDNRKVTMPSSGKPMMEFVAVKFFGEYGLPGGFVEPGETYMKRLQVEFMDEAMNALNMTKSEYHFIEKHLTDMVFEHGHFIYQGYIKDNRNTDNAWIEGAVVNIHDANSTEFQSYHLSPGDGAEEAKWLIAHSDMTFNPTHKEYLRVVVDNHGAHW